MGWIKRISDRVNTLFENARTPMPTIPPILLACEIMRRPGLSAMALAASIIRRLPEAGVPTGLNPDGSENVIVKTIMIGCEELVKEIKENSSVTCALSPGQINVTISGGNAGGPIIGTGTNVAPFTIKGIFQ
jgi:hypothetical protein